MTFNFNIKIILSFTGLLLILNGIFMFLCLPFSAYYGEGDFKPILISGLINAISGFTLWLLFRNTSNKDIKKRDGYLIVTMGWIIVSLFGSLPYVLSGAIPEYTNALFESISGYTTTGATILDDIESMPKGILFWRSFTQWIGGMGIIVLTVAILPILGIGGMQLFVAEAPGISPDKLHPRINATARRMWSIYIGLTVVVMFLLYFGGMNLYDAINHSLTTMASGGFSTRQESIGYYNSPFIQYTIVIFMLITATNFTLIYLGLHGKVKKVFKNEEFRFYLSLIVFFTIVVYIGILRSGAHVELAFREALFNVVAIITTTGYATADYTEWSVSITLIFLLFMFFGGCAGSTAGGVKLVRHIILFKNSYLELKRLVHPSAVIPVRFNDKAVSPQIVYNVLAFIIIYLMIFVTGSVIIAFLGSDFITAIGAVAATLGNVGPGIGAVGPDNTFADLSTGSKWVLSFLMIVGRLELFTVLILFTPFFWTRN